MGHPMGIHSEERAGRLPGDEFLEISPSRRVVAMTRAISIAAPPESVWPWIAQLGRGAGWYSVDRLDNGGKGVRPAYRLLDPRTTGGRRDGQSATCATSTPAGLSPGG